MESRLLYETAQCLFLCLCVNIYICKFKTPIGMKMERFMSLGRRCTNDIVACLILLHLYGASGDIVDDFQSYALN